MTYKSRLFPRLFELVCLLLSGATLLTGCSKNDINTEKLEHILTDVQNSDKSDQNNRFSDINNTPNSEPSASQESQNSRCADCHYECCQSWSGSFHRSAMNVANSQTVLADFSQNKWIHLAFDELNNLSEPEIQTLVMQWLQVSTEELDPWTGLPQPNPMLRLVYALSNSPDSLRKKFLTAFDNKTRTIWQAESEFAVLCGPVRPDRIAESQTKIVEFAKSLQKNGAVQNAIGTIIGLKKNGSDFIMNLEDRTGTKKDFVVKYVLGIFPLQQYLTEQEDGRIQILPIAWNTIDKNWFSIYPDKKILPNDPLHWTRPLQNWNSQCADCHTTDYRKNFHLNTNVFASNWNELGVGCAACHTGCYEHEEQARHLWKKIQSQNSQQNDRGTPLLLMKNEQDLQQLSNAIKKQLVRSGFPALTPNLTENSNSNAAIESCSPCHSRRRNLDEKIKPNGKRYSNFHVPDKIGSEIYYADGQFKEECFEYGSFTQSRMYAMGVRCTDCHDAHSVNLRKPGNQLCCQCHRSDFYDSPTHHQHRTAPTGASSPNSTVSIPVKKPIQESITRGPGMNCIDCHMPEMKFMTIDRRREHNIHIPRPRLTLDLGTPNACNLCHFRREKGENAAWAQSCIDRWFKPENALKRGRLDPRQHYAYAFAEGMKKSEQGWHLLKKIVLEKDSAKVRDLVRAGAYDLLAQYKIRETSDPSLNRSVKETTYKTSEAAQQKEQPESVDRKSNAIKSSDLKEDRYTSLLVLLKAGLSDPNDWVRHAAVSGFRQYDEKIKKEYLLPILNDRSRAVRSEAFRLLQSINTNNLSEKDRINFFHLQNEYRQELLANSDLASSWLNLGIWEQNLRQANLTQSQQAFQKLNNNPNVSEQLLSVARSELVKLEFESLKYIMAAYQQGIKIDPDFLPLRINLGMLFYQSGDLFNAEVEFRQAVRIDPLEGEAHYSLALLLAEKNETQKAAVEFVKAAELLPNRARVLYNCALALDRIGETNRAIDMAQRALRLDPKSKEYQKILNLFQKKMQNKK